MIEGFLLGVIVLASLVASAFFFKFWRQTRDKLFLGFSAAFAVEGVNRVAFLFVDHPEEGNPLLYTIRLFTFLVILAAIVNKNRA
jgi:uncharacterized membrane protein HdeD (DUF308 family)